MFVRHRQQELMDDPKLDKDEHRLARDGLSRINAAGRATQILFSELRLLAPKDKMNNLSVLDLATGSGDIPIALSQMAKVNGLNWRIDGCDFSDTATGFAKERAEATGADSRFYCVNVLTEDLPGEYDIVMNSLFMHHLSDDESVLLMTKMREAALSAVLVNDLERSHHNLAMVWIACHLLSTSRVVRFDGPASVRSAYAPHEFQRLAHKAGMNDAVIKTRFPCRFILTWKKMIESKSLTQ